MPSGQALPQPSAPWRTTTLRNFDLSLSTANVRADYSGNVVGQKQPALVRYRRKRKPQAAVLESNMPGDIATVTVL
jgi:hypothetical protein